MAQIDYGLEKVRFSFSVLQRKENFMKTNTFLLSVGLTVLAAKPSWAHQEHPAHGRKLRSQAVRWLFPDPDQARRARGRSAELHRRRQDDPRFCLLGSPCGIRYFRSDELQYRSRRNCLSEGPRPQYEQFSKNPWRVRSRQDLGKSRINDEGKNTPRGSDAAIRFT